MAGGWPAKAVAASGLSALGTVGCVAAGVWMAASALAPIEGPYPPFTQIEFSNESASDPHPATQDAASAASTPLDQLELTC